MAFATLYTYIFVELPSPPAGGGSGGDRGLCVVYTFRARSDAQTAYLRCFFLVIVFTNDITLLGGGGGGAVPAPRSPQRSAKGRHTVLYLVIYVPEILQTRRLPNEAGVLLKRVLGTCMLAIWSTSNSCWGWGWLGSGSLPKRQTAVPLYPCWQKIGRGGFFNSW